LNGFNCIVKSIYESLKSIINKIQTGVSDEGINLSLIDEIEFLYKMLQCMKYLIIP